MHQATISKAALGGRGHVEKGKKEGRTGVRKKKGIGLLYAESHVGKEGTSDAPLLLMGKTRETMQSQKKGERKKEREKGKVQFFS